MWNRFVLIQICTNHPVFNTVLWNKTFDLTWLINCCYVCLCVCVRGGGGGGGYSFILHFEGKFETPYGWHTCDSNTTEQWPGHAEYQQWGG